MFGKEHTQVYRASVAAILFNEKGEIFMVQNIKFRDDEWDFVKGGMDVGEDVIQTIEREIGEEIGTDVKFDIIRESVLQIVYDWSPEHQERRGMRGQARISFWVKYLGGEIKVDADELRNAKWMSAEEFEEALRVSDFSEFQIKTLVDEYEEVVRPLISA